MHRGAAAAENSAHSQLRAARPALSDQRAAAEPACHASDTRYVQLAWFLGLPRRADFFQGGIILKNKIAVLSDIGAAKKAGTVFPVPAF
jgi:hypothetical protein